MAAERTFLIRKNCEYSMLIENARDENEAVDRAEKVPLPEWGESWSSTTAEEEPER